MASTTKSKTSSPSKRSTMNGNSTKLNLIGKNDYVVMDKDLLRGLSEKEVEIEHLKTNITALN